MYIENTQKKVINLTSFEGFEFEIPIGVSWIWEKAGEHLLKTYEPQGEHGKWGYRIGAGQTDMGRGKVFISQEPPKPAIIEATLEDWENGGKRLCQIRRYKVNGTLIPREKLVELASERGISQTRLVSYANDKSIDSETIANDINSLPIPEEIKYPKNLENNETNNTSSN